MDIAANIFANAVMDGTVEDEFTLKPPVHPR
jgi:hypothetical protein